MKLLVEWRMAFERQIHIRSLMNIRVVMTLVRIIVKTRQKTLKKGHKIAYPITPPPNGDRGNLAKTAKT